MKKRRLAFCLLLTMACSIWQVPVLADELEEDALLLEETTEDVVLNWLPEELLPEDILDGEASVFADEEEMWDWQEEPSLQVARSRHAVHVVGNKIYVFGGGNAQNRMLDSVEIFDTVTRTWSTGAPMPIAKADFASAVAGNEIYIMGGTINTGTTGTNYTHTNSVEIYNTETNTWTTGTPLPSVRWSGRAVMVDGKIYVVAGTSATNLVNHNNAVDIYDIAADTWETGTPISNGMNRAYSAMVYLEGKIYVIGGWQSPATVVYDIENDHWSTAPLSGPFAYCAAAAHDNKIYVMTDNGQYYIYDVESVTRTTGPKYLYNSNHGRAAIVNGRLYLIGGEADSIMTSNMNSIQLADAENPPPPTENRLYVLLNISESVQLSLSHNLGINLDYNWSSTDETVATVNTNGYVTAEGEGTCFIYGENDEGYSDYIPIKVIEGNADEIRLAVHLTVGGQAKLYLSEDPTAVNWFSFDTNVVTVDNQGVLTANGRGLAIVQGEIDGEEYHIYVRVNS